MESEAFQASNGVGLPPQYEVNPVQPGRGTSGDEKPATRQKSSAAKPVSEPPVDMVDVSIAARALAREIADDEPHLQLSADLLSILATGDDGVEG